MSRPSNVVVLYRDGRGEMEEDELAAVDKNFHTIRYRTQVNRNELIIGRYSVLPFYKELEEELALMGARLINTYGQHRYVADLQNWVADLGDLTPMTWSRLEDLPEDGPFVLKGETNSKKFEWTTHMFAKNKREAIEVHTRLQRDGLIGSQDIYIREFVKLHTYYIGVGGLPVTKEFRIFVAYGKVVSGGFYWSNHADEIVERFGKLPVATEAFDFIEKVIARIGKKINFYALDVGQLENGEWTVIELNDGQMSGLSMNNPETLYRNLARNVEAEKSSVLLRSP